MLTFLKSGRRTDDWGESMKYLVAVACAALALASAPVALAQGFPRQPIKIVVPFPAGGSADLLTRSIAQKMTSELGQSVVVENRGGAAGVVGAAFVAHAPADGYTLGLGTLSTLALSAPLAKVQPYDERKDFTPIAMLTELPMVLAVPADFPANDLAGLVAYAKKSPDKMNYSTNGPGSSSHILAEMIKRRLGFEMTHVPYGGDMPTLNALMGSQIQLGIMAVPATVEFVKAGKVKALVVTGAKRSAALPNVPSVTELGYPDLVSTTWFCVVAPGGAPREAVEIIHREVNKAMASPDTLKVFTTGGLEPSPMGLSEFQGFVAKEQDRWGAAVKELGIQIE